MVVWIAYARLHSGSLFVCKAKLGRADLESGVLTVKLGCCMHNTASIGRAILHSRMWFSRPVSDRIAAPQLILGALTHVYCSQPQTYTACVALVGSML
jgi:hypothetical protein